MTLFLRSEGQSHRDTLKHFKPFPLNNISIPFETLDFSMYQNHKTYRVDILQVKLLLLVEF